MLNKAKMGLLNLGLKLISVDDKLVRMFLDTFPKSLQKIVLLPVTKVAMTKFLDLLGKSHQTHGLVHNGVISSVPVSVIRCQVGAPNAAILMECFHRAGVEKVVRCDYAGSMADSIQVGDLIVPEVAFGGDGTTPHYASREMPPNQIAQFEASPEITSALFDAARRFNYRVHKARVWTMDAIFRETPDNVAKWKAAGADSVDMESSAIYCLGQLFGIKTSGILAVSDKPGSEYDLFHTNRVHERLLPSLEETIKVVAAALPTIARIGK